MSRGTLKTQPVAGRRSLVQRPLWIMSWTNSLCANFIQSIELGDILRHIFQEVKLVCLREEMLTFRRKHYRSYSPQPVHSLPYFRDGSCIIWSSCHAKAPSRPDHQVPRLYVAPEDYQCDDDRHNAVNFRYHGKHHLRNKIQKIPLPLPSGCSNTFRLAKANGVCLTTITYLAPCLDKVGLALRVFASVFGCRLKG